MRIDKLIVASLCLLLILSTSCKPKVGGKCVAGQGYCTKDGVLFCGDDGKFTAATCRGPNGCVQHGKGASCDTSIANVGDGCEDNDNVACSVDKKSELDCKNHSWVLGATCKGAKGCELKGDELFCDHTLADKDDPCHRDGQIACTNDKNFILKCEGKVMKPIDTCRGPKSCTFEEHPEREIIEFSCDDSVAQEGDPCEQDNAHACAVDHKAIHVCKGKKFVSLKACSGPKGCTFDPATERLSCDTGTGGVFNAAGGAGKVSSAGGAAGGTTKGKTPSAAGSASAKPASSATVTGSASAKPAGSAAASATPTGSASGKPGASAAASASAAPAGSGKAATSASSRAATPPPKKK